MSSKKQLELLAPAGSFEKMKYAFAYGADAVYLGIPDFSMRVRINTFTMDAVKEAIDYAHSLNKKIYVTVNIVAHNKHLKKLPEYLKKLNIWKPDALIVSDPGVMAMVKKYAPNLEIHLSTQANATNWQTVKFWYDHGLERVVLGREVTLEEIKEINTHVPACEIEYFIHGAMCMSYSGRCMLSAWLAGRSANLGDCVQPCRWKYKISEGGDTTAETSPAPSDAGSTSPTRRGDCSCSDQIFEAEVEEPKRPGMKIPVEEDMHGTYIFNSKDMCFIEYLPELMEAGVISFKIEGRAKSVAYLSSVVKAYREAFDYLMSETGHTPSVQKKKLREIKTRMLDKLIHRGYTTGFLFGRDHVEQNIENSHTQSEEEFVGEVLSSELEGKTYRHIIRPHNALRVGDQVRIMMPNNTDIDLGIEKLYNEEGEEVESGHGGSGKHVVLYTQDRLEEYGILFKKSKF